MNFNYWDLGQQPGGAVVEITLTGTQANVRLMDSSNYGAFKAGRRHRYHGGLVKRSPVRLQVPSAGRWYVTVDYGGMAGRGSASVRVLPGQLPTFRPRDPSPIGSISDNAEAMRIEAAASSDSPPSWDVFISHATEDKDEVVRPLANALIERGLTVWYDEFELTIGKSLRRSIDEGLRSSRFGVVVLSDAFLSKNWPQYELDGLVSREMTGEQIILPLWHKLTKDEVVQYSPSLADKLARTTADRTLDEIAEEIAGVVGASASRGDA